MVSRRAFGGIVSHGFICHFKDGVLVIAAIAFNVNGILLSGMDYWGVFLPGGIFRDEVVASMVNHVGFFQDVPRIGVVKEIFQGGIAHGAAFVVHPVFVDEQLETSAFAPAFVYFENYQGMVWYDDASIQAAEGADERKFTGQHDHHRDCLKYARGDIHHRHIKGRETLRP